MKRAKVVSIVAAVHAGRLTTGRARELFDRLGLVGPIEFEGGAYLLPVFDIDREDWHTITRDEVKAARG